MNTKVLLLTVALVPFWMPAAAPGDPSGSQVIRINAGEISPFTDSHGNVWLGDGGFEGGATIARDASTPIAGTTDPELFTSEHYAMDAFSHNLPNGKYLARLYFAETYEGIYGPGERVFSFDVHGTEFKDFDVWAKAGGPNRAYVESVPVEVTDGRFRITFSFGVENPQINAIELIPEGMAATVAMLVSPSESAGVQTIDPGEDWQPSTTNQRGRRYPQVNRERRV